MLSQVQKLITNIEESDKCTSQLVPIELVAILEDGKQDADNIGRFLVDLRNKHLPFDFEVEEVGGIRKAYALVRESEREDQKIYYALAFVGKAHPITAKEVKALLRRIKP